jgi:hypothetical protein
LGTLERSLAQTLVHFGESSCTPGGSVLVDLTPHEFSRRPVTLTWASDEAAFDEFVSGLERGVEESAIPIEAISIVAVASTPFLKSASIVLDHPLESLDSIDPSVVLTEPNRVDAFSAPFNGFAVDLYLVLNRDLEPRPLVPHLLGTWISHARFRFETSLAPAILPPTPLTDDLRQQLGLQPKTIRYLQFGDHDLTHPYREQDQPTFYIDEQLLAQLSVRKSAPASRAIQLQLAHDFVSAVIRKAAADGRLAEVTYSDIHASLLGSVIRLAAGAGATDGDRDKLVDRILEDPEYVIARAEHYMAIGDGFTGALKESDS